MPRLPEIALNFEWSRDEKGYDLLPEEPWNANPSGNFVHPIFGKAKRTPSLLEMEPTPERIVPLGGRSVTYRPLAKHPDLFRAFATVRDSRSLLAFMNKFGSLTRLGAKNGEMVAPIVTNAGTMKGVLVAYGEGRRSEAAKLLEGDIILANLEATLGVDPKTKLPQVLIVPESLLQGLWLQAGQFIAGGRAVRSCLQCGQLFEVGRGTGRRLVAKFCSDAHRVAFNSLARTPKE